MSEMDHRTWVEISLEQIARNYHAVKAAAHPGAMLAAVVKADAYRHGAAQVAARLEREGAKWMAVSNANEGGELRKAGIRARILVMGGFLDFEREAILEYELTPVVHSLAGLRDLDRFAATRERRIAYHLKLDTGMGRLGSRAPIAEALDCARAAHWLKLEGLMTHFASANDFASPQTCDQIGAFQSIMDAFEAASCLPPLLHLSSSGPVAFQIDPRFSTLVRPGLALYGYVGPANGPAPECRAQVSPALTWKARILEIKEIPEGAPVGYGATWRAPRASTIAVVAAGYADGIPQQLGNRGHVVAGGRLAPMVGAVSMDLITVDVTGIPNLERGGAVTLIGRDGNASRDAQDMAAEAGVIAYAVLCGIGNRVVRIYAD